MAATVKVWSGSAWVTKPVKVWSGSAWVAKPLKFWNGSAWAGPSGGAIVAPAFRSQATTTYASRSSTLVTKPSGTVLNDVLVAAILLGHSGTVATDPTPPSGWTQVGTFSAANDSGNFFGKFGIWWKRAGGSEPADYTWAQGETCTTQGIIQAWSGCPAAGSPIDSFSQNSYPGGGTGAVATGTGVTTTQANDALLWLGHNWDGTGTLNPPASPAMTERSDSVIYAADQVIAAAGATGNRTQTLASSSQPWAAFLVALKGI